ncbi:MULTISPECIES: arsenic resistance protein [Halobacterium]|uniref:arsenic resistance protein n=1 Tax=Halobacterium TaxID=2239 RepID=UPI00073EA8C1|nr:MULTISPECIES: arsenic resistance protein [Halobacterium]MCG1003312.1 arsenic resistance protein [Halobacterium noricense]
MGRPSKRWLQHNQVAVYAVAVALAVVVALVQPSTQTALEALVNPVLAVLLYATFLEIPFVRIRAAFRNARYLGAALAMNFLVVPVVAFALTRPLASDPVVLVGALLVLLTPCIDYVVPFTELAGGDAEQVTATTPALMVVQLLLLPAYLWLFVGPQAAAVVDARPFVEAFAYLIAVPLTAAYLTERRAEHSERAREWQDAVEWLPVPAMAATLFVVIASQLPRVQDALGRVASVVPVYVAFLVAMPLLASAAGRRLDVDTGASRALVFTSVTRNSLVVLPLALALPAEYALAPAVVVTQTLVELCGMVALTRVVPAYLVPER